MNKNEYVLGIFKGKESINEDFYLNVDLESNTRPLPISDLSKTLNSAEQEQNERNESTCYRLTGNLNVVGSNVLFNISGDFSYQQILELKDLDEETDTFVNDLNEVLLEDDGWFFFQTGTTCDKVFLEPKPDKFYPLANNGFQNWEVYVTYPASGNIETLTFNNVPITDGISVVSINEVTIDDRQMTAVVCSINHGLSVGDIVRFNSDIPIGLSGDYSIYQLGLDDKSFQSSIFILDEALSVYPPINNNTKLRFKKVVNGVESDYYSRWFKKLTNTLDYEIYPTGFATNIFNDQNFSFTFNNDLDVNGLVDYLGRPLTEFYLTIVKKQSDSESLDNFWTNVESGINTALVGGDYDVNTLNSFISNDSIEENVNSLPEIIFGDIVEYNRTTLTETILQDAYHRFNTLNRRDEGFLEGYYYKPHYVVPIREFSDFIEESTNPNETVPDYAEQLDGNRRIWRDLFTNSFSDNPNIPFINGCHYLYGNFNILVKRQDPCDEFNVGSNAIITGNCDTEDRFTQEQIEEICK